MRVLFIGGTGNISTACTRLAADRGIDLTVMVRGNTAAELPRNVRVMRCDVRDPAEAASSLGGMEFDTVVDWVAYVPDHVEADISLFRGRVRQYIFISSASAYLKPPRRHVVTESTPLSNPFWQYARDKIACEERLLRAHRGEGFPVTIVRPSLTYGERWIPCAVGGHDFTVADRMRKGKQIIVHGDGQSLWTVTHNSDFATGLLGLVGNGDAVGESYHITSDEVLTWEGIYHCIGRAAGVEPRLVHVPSDLIAAFDQRAGASLLGDKAYSVVFDNTKIKRAVPGFEARVTFAEGMRRSFEWFEADPRRQVVNHAADALMDRILQAWSRAWPPMG